MDEYALPVKFLEDTRYHSFNVICIKHSQRLYPAIFVLMIINKVPAESCNASELLESERGLSMTTTH